MTKIKNLIRKEEKRQKETLMLIPSKNYAPKEVRQALCSMLNNKYSEGYPGKRYYQGNKYIDQIESIAIETAKKLFCVPYANVQSYSGSPANSAVYMALLNPGDKILGLALSSGGHLTHGHPKITFSGKFFQSFQYEVGADGFIDYEALEKLAKKVKPKIIIAGTTSYPRKLEWTLFSQVADKVGAILLADISHIAGLVAAGVHPSPVRDADVVTTTTHKTLRGPRGALIMVTKKGLRRDPDMAKKIDRAVFPGLQGGPHNAQTAAIAIALKAAQSESFKKYVKQIIINSKTLAKELKSKGFDLVSGGTDNHIILIDLRQKGVLGKEFSIKLEKAGIIVNYNSIPGDPNPPNNPSGIRLGTPAVTTRGMGVKEMMLIADFINRVYLGDSVDKINKEVKSLCRKFPTL